MTALLNGPIAKKIGKAFKKSNLTYDGQIYRHFNAAGLDEEGYPEIPYGKLYPCHGYEDAIVDRFTGQTDAKMMKACIFAYSLPAGFVPRKGDIVHYREEWLQLVDVTTDAATALWTCTAFKTKMPADVIQDGDSSVAFIQTPQPSFKAVRSTDTAIPPNVWTQVMFDTVSHNVQAEYSTSAGNCRASAAGVRTFTGKLIVKAAGLTPNVAVKFFMNGVAMDETETFWFNDWQNDRLSIPSLHTQSAMTIGDVVDVRIFAEDVGVTLEALTNQFTGAYIGTVA